MVEIIPTIIAKDIKEVEEKIRLVEPYVSLVQLDIMDGEFVAAKTWNKPEELAHIKTTLAFEADLMMADPIRGIKPWLTSPVLRIFVQIEPFKSSGLRSVRGVLAQIHENGKQAGLILNVETAASVVEPFIPALEWVMLRGAVPGSYGQKFQDIVLDKVRSLREKYPKLNIMVDGGVGLHLVKLLKEAGVNALAVGSAIWKASDIKQAIEALKNEAK